jgi:hypothetical protein
MRYLRPREGVDLWKLTLGILPTFGPFPFALLGADGVRSPGIAGRSDCRIMQFLVSGGGQHSFDIIQLTHFSSLRQRRSTPTSALSPTTTSPYLTGTPTVTKVSASSAAQYTHQLLDGNLAPISSPLLIFAQRWHRVSPVKLSSSRKP